MKRYFEGDEASRIGEVTLNIVMDYLRAGLVARADITAICPGGVLVTPALATAVARFKAADSQAFLLVQELDHDEGFDRIRVEGEGGASDTTAPGACHAWTFELQLSARNDTAAKAGPSNAAILDKKLSDAVCAVFNDGRAALQELGLTVVSIKGSGNQGDTSKINPHLLVIENFTKNNS